MLINPKQVIENGWIKLPEGVKVETVVQPNAIDFTADELWQLDLTSTFTLSESVRVHRARTKVEPDADGFWTLLPGCHYEFGSKFFCTVPEGAAAEVTVRSSLNRSGVQINTGIWDSGFSGHLGGMIYNPVGTTRLGVGTRIGQIKFTVSASEGTYTGGYNAAEGSTWHDGKQGL